MTAPLVSIGQGEYRRDYYAPLKITANHSELDIAEMLGRLAVRWDRESYWVKEMSVELDVTEAYAVYDPIPLQFRSDITMIDPDGVDRPVTIRVRLVSFYRHGKKIIAEVEVGE